MGRHDVEVVFVLLNTKQTSYFLTRRTKDWIRGEHGVVIDRLLECDYTLECAKFRADTSVAGFLHYARVLATKRALFFRPSSPLRYMMECFLEEINLLDRMTNVGNALRVRPKMIHPTVYRKTSVHQDGVARMNRKRKRAMEKASRAHERAEQKQNRERIRTLRRRVKWYEDLFRRRRTILRVSQRFSNSRRDWSYGQRDNLKSRVEALRRSTTRIKTLARMKEVIVFYVGAAYGDDCDPQLWTVQTCRHVSHVIR